MKPVMQSKLWTPEAPLRGNCNAASLASLLEIPLWMVPPFEDMRGDLQDERRAEWLTRMFGFELVRTEAHAPERLPEFYIACGPSPRGTADRVYHAAVYRAGALAHDPHPLGGGINEVEWTWHLKEALTPPPIRHMALTADEIVVSAAPVRITTWPGPTLVITGEGVVRKHKSTIAVTS